ncbi:hypothetical protein EUGRSUZ_F00615 [Eucalyptus grandis]|uniref:Uncharacterized protein n=2 Tax=Eucalyptus grandis TaxID=71139 RepID=A0ACC3KBX0_EUCGR|nr:hypothetical protein EUGRSUZ_F00615 [Eucalyptus grandis]
MLGLHLIQRQTHGAKTWTAACGTVSLMTYHHSLSILRHLWSLNLSYNDFFGTRIWPNLSTLSELTHLNLSGSYLSGTVPSEISHLSKLESLDLSENYFFGVFLDTVFRLPSLTTLDISLNVNLFGILPKSNWTSPLVSLDLGQTYFSGEIPNSIGNMKSLAVLNIQFGVIGLETSTDARGKYIFPKLEVLGLSSVNLTKFPSFLNSISGEIPSLSGNMSHYFGNITSLGYLDLGRNKLQGSLPRSLVKCSSLSILDLSHNEFNDIFPHWLQAPLGPISLPSPVTYYYSIASNNMNGKIPSLLCNATELGIIDFSNNSLIGSLSWCLKSFSTDLSVLQLQMNYLEGTIPQSFSLRNSLMTLDLSRNHFEGTLPQSLVKCTNLQVLDLSDNWIKDMFPRWLGTLPELKVLSLKSNNFKGDIPEVIGHLQSLIELNLSHNHLTGFIPPTLGNLSNLRWLDLSFNKLSGEIPRHLSTFSSNSFSRNLGLCGTPLPKACLGDDIQPPLPSSSSISNYEGHERWFEQKAMWIGYASGIVIRVSIAYIAFQTGMPKWLTRGVRMLERRAVEWMKKLK